MHIWQKKKEKKVSGTGVNRPNGPKFSEILRLLANLWEMKMNVFDVRLWQGRLMCFYSRNEDAEKKNLQRLVQETREIKYQWTRINTNIVCNVFSDH